MNTAPLRKARAIVAKARAAVAKDDAALHAVQRKIDALNGQIEKLRTQRVAKRLHETLERAERTLAAAEEDAVRTLAIELAGTIIKRMSHNPVRHHDWIVAQIAKLRTMIRSEVDTPLAEKYSQHPLITQALSLLPPPDDLDRPVYDLGYGVPGLSDWASRRSRILAEAEAA